MDATSQSISLEDFTQSTAGNNVGSNLLVDQSLQPVLCAFCQRDLSADNQAIGDLERINICGDCKFLFLEDVGTPTHDSHERRIQRRRRRTRYSSSESSDSIFSQQFSHIINLATRNQSTVSGLDDLSVEVDVETLLLQHRSRTTPRRSRRWWQVLSDTESDGLENVDSLYAESESNVSFSRYRVSHSESDDISFSSYGGDSDASVDLRGFLDSEMFIQPNEGSDFDSDSDIDPMHAGLNQWNLDDQEEINDIDGESEDSESEEGDAEENTIESTEAARLQFQNLLFSATSESNYTTNWHPYAGSPEPEGMIWWRIRQNRQTYGRTILTNLEESDLSSYVGNYGDYLDGRGFEELLQHLAETDNSSQVSPPTAASFVNSLPCVIISMEHVKHDGLACAICKDLLSIGTEVNQLPCNHLYHPSCILPWLSSRNSCPLCRFELPTDDKDYEDGKLNVRNGVEIHNVQQNSSEDSSSNTSDRDEEDEEDEVTRARLEPREILNAFPAINRSGTENGRGRWFFLAAAPIVSLMGIFLVLWLGNSLAERRSMRNGIFPEQAQHAVHIPGSLPNQRENRRRWWSLF